MTVNGSGQLTATLGSNTALAVYAGKSSAEPAGRAAVHGTAARPRVRMKVLTVTFTTLAVKLSTAIRSRRRSGDVAETGRRRGVGSDPMSRKRKEFTALIPRWPAPTGRRTARGGRVAAVTVGRARRGLGATGRRQCRHPAAPPSDAQLAKAPARHDLTREQFYFVLPDRFANGDRENDRGV
ncbi:hypothetical protein GCM10023238_26290 [Streptomyces heliomycini]